MESIEELRTSRPTQTRQRETSCDTTIHTLTVTPVVRRRHARPVAHCTTHGFMSCSAPRRSAFRLGLLFVAGDSTNHRVPSPCPVTLRSPAPSALHYQTAHLRPSRRPHTRPSQEDRLPAHRRFNSEVFARFGEDVLFEGVLVEKVGVVLANLCRERGVGLVGDGKVFE